MATDIFAKIGDIAGESLDDKYKENIEVLSWSWGLSQTSSPAPGGGSVTGKVNFSDFNFTHRLDKASPLLMKACATGEHIKEATITMRKAGQGQHEFLIIKMNDVLVTTVQAGVFAEQDATTESIALQFAKVEMEYKPQKADGTLDAGVVFKYDIKADKEG